MLATLLRPTSGDATICGHDVLDVRRVRPLLGVALQEVGLDPLMTGRQHFAVQAALYRIEPAVARRRTDELIDRFELGPYVERKAGMYSGGMQRRLAIALALTSDPTVLLLDEPTAGLDPRSRREVWRLVGDLRQLGKICLFSTQYMEEADQLSDRLYVIDHGVIVASGTPATLKSIIGDATLRISAATPPAEALAMLEDTLPAARGAGTQDRDALVFRLPPGSDLSSAILRVLQARDVGLREFSLTPPTLEDVFLHLTGHGVEPEPLGQGGMDVMMRMQRGGGKRWK
jgi:ABC-type multidrug transport system ATPase subunit